ncbi:MAG: hypothetical protein RQ729_00245 [Wenzhouxiangellaceae bacterium]|nr:hypothetical protein [Wenzhouxiangellaceae bacterium]
MQSSVRQRPVFFALCLLTLFWSSAALGHGLNYRIERGQAVQVWFSSHHEDALANAGFRVFTPADEQIFVRGRTDRLGRAVFVPDRAGQWRLLLATEDGHGAEVEIEVSADSLTDASEMPPLQLAGVGRLSGTLAGLGYLAGLAGLLLLLRRHRDA